VLQRGPGSVPASRLDDDAADQQEGLGQLVTEDMVSAPCGPDPGPYIKAIRAHQEAGFDEICLGHWLEGAFDFLAT
jgi:hypothetical protein